MQNTLNTSDVLYCIQQNNGALFKKVAAHKKITETRTECAYTSFTTNVRIYIKILRRKRYAFICSLFPMLEPPAKFF